MFVDYLGLLAKDRPVKTYHHLIRAGCTCEGHDHVEDSWFPDFCRECKCVCNQKEVGE